MPANQIRRSDAQSTEKYQTIVKNLENIKEDLHTPKFYEYGKAISYQENDASYLPAITTNMITLSNIDNKYNNGHNMDLPQENADINIKSDRANTRRLVAQLKILDKEKNEVGNQCPQCHSYDIELDFKELNNSPNELLPYKCNNCGNKWTVLEKDIADEIDEEDLGNDIKEKSLSIDENDINNEMDIISSIQSLLPQVTAKSNQTTNKMAKNLISGLVNSLEMNDGSKQWLIAQIENGILDTNVFMRNIKTAMLQK